MMRSICVWALVAAGVGPLAAAEQDFIDADALRDAGLAKFWQLRLPLEPEQRLQDVFLVDDTLYVGTSDGYVFAMDAYTGVIRWLRPITRSTYHVRRPCHAGGRVVFVTATDIQVYDRRSGDPVARSRLRFPPGTAGVSDGTRIFIGGLDRRLYAFDVETQFLDWRIITDGPIVSAPALHGEHVFAANDGGTLYACTRKNKLFHWDARTYGPVAADLVADERGVFVASRDQSLYLFDVNYGQLRWQVRFSGPLHEAPVVSRELAFQYCPDDGLVAVELTQVGIAERVRWKLPGGRTALTIADKLAYVLSKEETLLAVQLQDGAVAHTIAAPGFTLGMPAIKTQTLFVASPDGRVFCARPRGAPPLRLADLQAALRPSQPDKGTAAAQATTQPAAKEAVDPLRTGRRGMPIGGKSKISREYERGGRSD